MAQKSKKSADKAPSQAAPLAHGVGRRKRAVARVWMRKGSGNLMVNGKPYTEYFTVAMSQMEASKPFKAAPKSAEFDFDVNVSGGGFHSQADAVKLGVSRALLSSDEELRSTLRENGLLTVDDRVKERKKYGQRGARRKFQFVKR